MRPALFPRHVAAFVRHQKEPRKALEMFNSVRKENEYEHNLLTYSYMIEKLGYHGEFEAMEDLIVELSSKVEWSSLEGVYVGAFRSYGRKGRVQQAFDVFERMDFHFCNPSVQSYSAIMNVLIESGYHDQAHKVYLRMIDRGITPDVYTFTVRIKSFCKTGRPHAPLRLLRNMPLQGCENNAIAYCHQRIL
ncbi:hypothetical protein MLD38_031929 [Melastoma candidum]|uniref:Uncharacterized protein n=1 Tax=Melastoma candidum TaxID=119954 RepID=A0ACB9MR72_9MYRT|nr:hypothetical protein MLD38_031929 [Melastoma candidum]